MQRIRETERAYRRLCRLIRTPAYTPLAVFELERPFHVDVLRQRYQRLVKLLHPDRNQGAERFNAVFNVVLASYRALTQQQQQQAVEHKQPKQRKPLETEKKNALVEHGTAERAVVLHRGKVLHKFKYNVVSTIAVDGAEHTTNKSKSKSDKHQKGLRQRVVARQNAVRRMRRHQFAFGTHCRVTAREQQTPRLFCLFLSTRTKSFSRMVNVSPCRKHNGNFTFGPKPVASF